MDTEKAAPSTYQIVGTIDAIAQGTLVFAQGLAADDAGQLDRKFPKVDRLHIAGC